MLSFVGDRVVVFFGDLLSVGGDGKKLEFFFILRCFVFGRVGFF